MDFASDPSHFPEDTLTPSKKANQMVRSFLARFPEGVYEFDGGTVSGAELVGRARLTHVLPALPEIVAPVSDTDDIPWLTPTTRPSSGSP